MRRQKKTGAACPHCGQIAPKNGFNRKGVQRYRCRSKSHPKGKPITFVIESSPNKKTE